MCKDALPADVRSKELMTGLSDNSEHALAVVFVLTVKDRTLCAQDRIDRRIEKTPKPAEKALTFKILYSLYIYMRCNSRDIIHVS
jgi:hypothetical protein